MSDYPCQSSHKIIENEEKHESVIPMTIASPHKDDMAGAASTRVIHVIDSRFPKTELC